MHYYVISLEGQVVAKFVQRHCAQRYANCYEGGRGDLPVVVNSETPEDLKALIEQRLALILIANGVATPEALLAKLSEAPVPVLGHYSVRDALRDLFAVEAAMWTTAKLQELCMCPRITIACQLTVLRKRHGLRITLDKKDKHYRVR
jgi:hypothetical protein